MANSIATQIMMDGPRNTMLKVTGILDTADLTNQVILDPSTLSGMMAGGAYNSNSIPDTVAIKRIEFSIEDTLDIKLSWDATVPVLIEVLDGRGVFDWTALSFLQNNAGAGKTGKVLLSTQGWSGSAVLSFSLTFWFIKQKATFDLGTTNAGQMVLNNGMNTGEFLVLF